MKNSCLSGPKSYPKCGKELESYANRFEYCDKEFSNKTQRKKSQ